MQIQRIQTLFLLIAVGIMCLFCLTPYAQTVDTSGNVTDVFVKDTDRVSLLAELLQEGYEKQILLTCDLCLKSLLHAYGGWGYDHVLTNIVPMMREYGIAEQQIDRMLRENPADFLDVPDAAL